jgi:hypothetical protein
MARHDNYASSVPATRRSMMDEDTLNMSVRKYLKNLGVTSQREIEQGVRDQLDAGALKGDEELPVTATVVVRGLPGEIVVEGTIKLA